MNYHLNQKIYVSEEDFEKYLSPIPTASYIERCYEYQFISKRGTVWYVDCSFGNRIFKISRPSSWGMRYRIVCVKKCTTGIQKRNMYKINNPWDIGE